MLLEEGRPVRQGRLIALIDYLNGGLAAMASLCVLIALWQIAADSLGALVLPAPLAVFARAEEIVRSVVGQQTIWATLRSGFMGILLALTLGIGGGFIAGNVRTIAVFLRPWIMVILGTPPIIWVVLALFWFAQGAAVTVFTVAVAITPMVFAAAMSSVITRPQALLDMAQVYQMPLIVRLQHIWLPHLAHTLLPAVSVAAGSGLKLTVMAELLGGTTGIGLQIADARAMLDTLDVLAYVVIIVSLIMLIEYGILEPIKRLVLPA